MKNKKSIWNALLWSVAFSVVAGEAWAWEGFGFRVSSTTQGMVEDLRTLSLIQPNLEGRENLGRFFDGGMPLALGQSLAGRPITGNWSVPSPQAFGLRMPSFRNFIPPGGGEQLPDQKQGSGNAQPTPSNRGGLHGLRKIQVGGNGTLYGLYGNGFFRSLQKGVPDANGMEYNKDGQYVGQWKTIQKPRFSKIVDFDVKTVDGREAIYTARKPLLGRMTSIYEDGKFQLKAPHFQEFHVDGRGKVYVRREQKGYSTISILRPDGWDAPDGYDAGDEKVLYTIPHGEQRHVHHRRVVNSNGGVAYDPYEEKHSGGISSFEVTPSGGIYWIQNGTLYKGEYPGKKIAMGQRVSERSPVIIFKDGNISHFQSDSRGNLFAVTDRGDLFFNGGKVVGASIGMEKPELKQTFSMGLDNQWNAYLAFQNSSGEKKITRWPLPIVTIQGR